MKIAGWSGLAGALAFGGAFGVSFAGCALDDTGADLLQGAASEDVDVPGDRDAASSDGRVDPDPGDGEPPEDGGLEAAVPPVCNGATDVAGCPKGLAWGGQLETERYVKTNLGNDFTSSCASGYALVGADAETQSGYIRRIRAICAQVSIVADTNAPSGYRVAVAADATTLAFFGTRVGGFPSAPPTTASNARCAADAVVVGIRGQAGAQGADTGVTHLVFTCAKLVVNKGETTFSLQRDEASSASTEVGTAVDNTELATFTRADGTQVATGSSVARGTAPVSAASTLQCRLPRIRAEL